MRRAAKPAATAAGEQTLLCHDDPLRTRRLAQLGETLGASWERHRWLLKPKKLTDIVPQRLDLDVKPVVGEPLSATLERHGGVVRLKRQSETCPGHPGGSVKPVLNTR